MNRSCANCEFWVDLKIPGQDVGECRAGLPTKDYVSTNVDPDQTSRASPWL